MYRPWVGRKFGVEIELIRTTVNGGRLTVNQMRSCIDDALQAMQLPSDRLQPRNASYWHSDGTTWDVKTDSSCGWEIASPVMYLDDEGKCQELREVCHRLTTVAGAKVDTSCGLHVHIETRDMTWRQVRRLVRLWARYEPFFFSLVPPSRRSNSYCPSLYSQNWGEEDGNCPSYIMDACRAESVDRWNATGRRLADYRSALNMGHYWRNHRIEIRLHQGTVSAVKIEKWVMLMTSMVARAYRDDLPEIAPPEPSRLAEGLSTEYICRSLGLLPSAEIPDVPEAALRLVRWLTQRQAQFAQSRTALRNEYQRQAAQQSAVVMPSRPATPRVPPAARMCEAVMGLHVSQVYDGQPRGNCATTALQNSRFCAAHHADAVEGRQFRIILPAVQHLDFQATVPR